MGGMTNLKMTSPEAEIRHEYFWFKNLKLERNANYFGSEFWGDFLFFLGGGGWNPGKTMLKNSWEHFAEEFVEKAVGNFLK